jgi:hypothetical protein
MDRLKNQFKRLAIVIGTFLFFAVASAESPKVAFYGAIAVLLFSLLTLFRPMPKLLISNRATAVALILVAGIGIVGSNDMMKKDEAAQLAALRSSDTKAYLAAVKGKIDDTSYLAELKSLDAAAYQTELDRRVAAEKVEQELKMEALQRTLANLKGKIPAASTLPVNEQLALYTQLVDLDPKSDAYKRERDRLKAIVKAQEDKNLKAQAEKLRIENAIENPEKFLEITKWSWSKGGFGAIMIATFTIKNTSPFDIKDITIHCTDSAPSGTVIDSNDHTIYDLVKANSTKTFREVNMGLIHSQASSSGCHVVSATLSK